MSWEDQGRQEHGWFGHGAAPEKPKSADLGALSTNASRGDLATALAYGAIASMPAGQRARAEASFQGRNLTAFREATLAWMRGTGMEPETFADRFFGRSADDPVAQALRDAAKLAMTSTTPADMAAASGKVADAMQRVGLERWSRFLADAQTRARDPATEAAIKASMKAPDAIASVYPLESIIGARGAIGLLRAGVGTTLRQLSSRYEPGAGGSAASSVETPPGSSARASTEGQPTAPESPAAQSAASVRDKLERYTLNLEHRRGGSKARWFQQALGFTRENSEALARQLVFDEKSAVQTGMTEFGTKYNQTINVVGANGRTIPVITAWLRGTDGVVRLITALPGK